ncbi:NAD(P)H-quinone oxidoreductase [Aeromicrobium phragmitis]|uniref:NAD(P)H-quinone oxidoreductase n=1 Tax=Aeromicrobium phragmitis TaxID=2478914 RepID=A0A3L8PPN2_9ACTN|nr:NAD(P)H-quinone oxidoreductase [Aeromicrobium phragmitis]RLV57346.1 NAD(P)H-quinone oxidoreductase [Aeromicrobium phragmitis]
MRAVMVNEPGGPEALEVVDVPVPQPGPGEVLLRVASAGVNRADILQRQGHYDPPAGATRVLGLECAGEVVAVGEGVGEQEIGSQVCALLTGGGYAEYVAVPIGQIAPVPEGVDLVTAGGLMETFATVWSNVFMIGRLQPGETLLVHGGSSGIGTTAIQVAKAFGARVVTTVGSPQKAEFCRELGADLAIDYRQEDFVEVMREAGVRADVILDIIGAKYLARNIAALATSGRLVVIGLQGGVKGELNLGALLAKRAAVTATSLRARPAGEKTTIVQQMTGQVWPLIADGAVRPIVHATMPLEQVARAHEVMEESSHRGKLILTLNGQA